VKQRNKSRGSYSFRRRQSNR